MKIRGRRSASRRLAGGLATCALTLVLVGLSATGAGAANAPQSCPAPSAGQSQIDTGATTGGGAGDPGPQPATAQEAGTVQSPPANGQTVEQGAVCAGSVSMAQGDGAVCTISLPEGAAPGTTIVVGPGQAVTAGSAGTACTVDGVDQTATGSGGVTGGVAGSGAGECTAAFPADGAPSTAAVPNDVPAGQTVVIDEPQVAGATGQAQGCSGSVTTSPQTGGQATSGGAQAGAGDTPLCTVVSAGGAAVPQPVTVEVNGQILICGVADAGGASTGGTVNSGGTAQSGLGGANADAELGTATAPGQQ